MKSTVKGALVIAVLLLAGAGAFYVWRAAGRAATPVTAVAAGPQARRILHYRNPMGLPDTSPVPKKDSMGMDYVPVYADEAMQGATVRIDAGRLQKLGVRTEPAMLQPMTRTLRVVGTVQADESLQTTVSPRFEGWITQLFVGTTGAAVRSGQPLLEVYSPELLSAQQDYQLATRTLQSLGEADAGARAGMERLVQGSLERLRNRGIAEADLAALQGGAAPRRTTVLRAQRGGVVTEKTARVGMRFEPGDALYQVADLSRVWLVGRVFEQDLALVRLGAPASVTFVAYPGEQFSGKITFIAPVLQAGTRTVDVRIELANPAGRLKPDMYGSVDLIGGGRTARLAVPDSAVLDTGTRQLVLVDRGGGGFEPRAVRTGIHADGHTEILAGLEEGEAVVVNGNFLIDSESNLRAAVSGMTPGAGETAATRGGGR